MSVDVLLLRIGSTTMESATVLEWHAEVGAEVSEGEPIVALEADKVEIDLPAPASGVLLRKLAGPGDEIPVGGKLGEIGDSQELAELPDDEPGDARMEAAPEAGPPESSPDPSLRPEAGAVSGPAEVSKVRAAPPARKLAEKLGVDLNSVKGTGPGGLVQSVDVRAAASEDQQEVPRASAAVRQRIATRMARSARETASVTLMRRVDATELASLVARLKESSTGEKRPPSIEDIVIQACARSLRRFPYMNGSWVDDELKTGKQININVAIQAPTGLLVPVIHQADRLDLDQIAAERRRLIASALEGSLDAQDVSNGTFTITNLGAFGVDAFTPIITVPQIAVLGVGRLTDMVVPKGSGVAVVPTMQLSLAFDHRAVDGAPAAEFLADVAEGLQAMQARSDATDHSH